MKKILLLFTYLVGALCVTNAQTPLRIVDATDQIPVISASVFDSEGNIIGYSMYDGTLPTIPETAYPITIRSIGYELLTIPAPENRDWLMTPKNYDVETVVVVPSKHEVVKQTVYVRMFCSGGNSVRRVQEYVEFMGERFIPVTKGSKFNESDKFHAYPAASYKLDHTKERDSLSYQTDYAVESYLRIFGLLPEEEFEVPDSFKNADSGTTLSVDKPGKSGPLTTVRQKGEKLTFYADIVAKKKNHVWTPWLLKLFGVKLSVHKLNATLNFRVNPQGIYHPKDILDCSINMELDVEGKKVEKAMETDEPFALKFSIEMYPTESEALTLQGAQYEIQNRPKTIPLTIPDHATPLNPEVLELIQEVMASQRAQAAQ